MGNGAANRIPPQAMIAILSRDASAAEPARREPLMICDRVCHVTGCGLASASASTGCAATGAVAVAPKQAKRRLTGNATEKFHCVSSRPSAVACSGKKIAKGSSRHSDHRPGCLGYVVLAEVRTVVFENRGTACINTEIGVHVIAVESRPDDKGKRNALVAQVEGSAVGATLQLRFPPRTILAILSRENEICRPRLNEARHSVTVIKGLVLQLA